MTSLLTDKRLLPYLEPSRYPMPTRMKAEQRDRTGAERQLRPVRDRTPGRSLPDVPPVPIRPRPELRGQRHLDAARLRPRRLAGSGEVPRHRPAHEHQPQSGIPFSKFVQANGQNLLVQLGTWSTASTSPRRRSGGRRTCSARTSRRSAPGQSGRRSRRGRTAK